LKIIVINTHPIQYFAPLYRKMAEEGLDVEVWYCSDESIKGKLDKGFSTNVKWDIPLLDGYPYRFYKNQSWRPSIYNGFWGLINIGILKCLFKAKKSVVLVHGWANFTSAASIIIAKISGHTVCLRGESPLNQELIKPVWNRFIKKIWLQLFLFLFIDKFLYIGKQNKAFYKYYGVKEKKLVFTPYAVDNERFQNAAKELLPRKMELRRKLGLPENGKIILYSGKYIPKKRPIDLLEAYKLLTQQHNQLLNLESEGHNSSPSTELLNYVLLMVGDGGLRSEMEAYISKHNLRNVFLTGFINQSDIAKYYAVSDVFVMCSGLGETWGLSVNEATNFNLPLVVSDITGCANDLVKAGENGYISITGNPENLKTYIVESLKLCKINSVNLIQQYSYSNIIDNFKKEIIA